MRFNVLATDYDGTLAHGGQVDEPTLKALERLRASLRQIVLVTGREIENLKRVFSRLDLFEVVVAENGAVLYYPATDTVRPLHKQLPSQFVSELRQRGAPVSVGHVIVSSREPHDLIILDVIKDLGLELEIIFNKGAVMVLPSGVNKATGLDTALRERGWLREQTVAIADAENDHTLLRYCGCAVAVSNALPSVKKAARFVTRSACGAGVVELIDRLIATDLADLVPPPANPSGDDPDMLLARSGVRTGEAP